MITNLIKISVILISLFPIESVVSKNSLPTTTDIAPPVGAVTITSDHLCGDFSLNFKVESAFKVGSYLCLIGKLWKNSSSESYVTAVRVKQWFANYQTPTFHEPTVWYEIQQINERLKIKYAFNTDNLSPLFQSQKMSEITFLMTEFNYTRIQSSEEPTFDPQIDYKLVYDSNIDGFDYSDELSLTFILNHFPPEANVKILSMIFYDRGYKVDGLHINFAIVYTQGIIDGKIVYMRHYLRSERNKLVDVRGRKFDSYYLTWYIDENNNFCQTLEKAPTAVVHLRTEVIQLSRGRFAQKYVSVKYVEFFGLFHQRNQLLFKYWGNNTFQNEPISDYLVNSLSLLKCDAIPIFTPKPPITCGDYPIEEINDRMNRIIFMSSDESSKNSKFALVMIVITVLLIIIVLVMALILVVKRTKN